MVMPAYILKEVKQENIFKAVDGESSNRYAVFEPNDTDSVWFVGWSRKGESAKVSRVVLSGPVRVRIGTKNTSVFGFSLLGKEIQLNKIGEDNSGTGGEFSLIPLL